MICILILYVAKVLKGFLELQSSDNPLVLYSVQPNRDPPVYAHYLKIMEMFGLKLTIVDVSSVPNRFEYDKSLQLFFHTVSLMNSEEYEASDLAGEICTCRACSARL